MFGLRLIDRVFAENEKEERRMSIYEKFGLRKVINARGAGITPLGASVMKPEVAAAMVEASKSYVYMSELRKKAGEVISRVTGAEAGCVANGAAAGISIMTAACMCGANIIKLGKLPNTEGLKNEVIIPWGHMHHYVKGSGNCIEITGAKLVPVGSVTGSIVGMCDFRKDLEEAINDKTAAVFFTTSERIERYWQPTFEDVTEVAHKRGVPVIVDQAVDLDLRYLVSAGADLTTFSGGKQLAGPASVGIICGRKDLIEACELTEWTIARTMKVSKEEIVALMVALEEWEKRDWTKWASSTATMEQATRWAQYIYNQLTNATIPYVEVKLMSGVQQTQVIGKIKYTPPPQVRLILHEEFGMSTHEVYEAVAAGDPSVLISNHNENLGFLDINPSSLIEGEEKIAAEKVRKVLTERRKTEEIVPYPFVGAH